MMEEQSLNRFVHFMRLAAFFILLLNIYYFLYPLFDAFKLTDPRVNFVFMKIAKTGLFKNNHLSKLLALLLLVASSIGTTGVKNENISGKSIVGHVFLGLVLYFGSFFLLKSTLPDLVIGGLYAGSLLAGFFLLVKGGNYLSRLISGDMTKDLFNEENESFPQEERLIKNEFSVNIRTKYLFKRQYRRGVD